MKVAGAGTDEGVLRDDVPGAAPELEALEHGESRYRAVATVVLIFEEGLMKHFSERRAVFIDGVGDAAGNLVDLAVQLFINNDILRIYSQ